MCKGQRCGEKARQQESKKGQADLEGGAGHDTGSLCKMELRCARIASCEEFVKADLYASRKNEQTTESVSPRVQNTKPSSRV